VCIPTFADIVIDGQGRTAIRLAVEDRTRRQPTAVVATDGHLPAAEALAAAPAGMVSSAGLAHTNGAAAALTLVPDVGSTATAAYQASPTTQPALT